MIAGLLYSMPMKEGRRFRYHEVHDIGRALLCCNHCSTNGAPACKVKTTQPTDKGYGLTPSLRPGLMLRQESAFKQLTNTALYRNPASWYILAPSLIFQLLVYTPSLPCHFLEAGHQALIHVSSEAPAQCLADSEPRTLN